MPLINISHTDSSTLRRPWGAAAVIVLLVFLACLGPWLSPLDPEKQSLSQQLRPPVFAGGGWDRPLGTDYLGRDILSRIMVGARVTVVVSFLGVLGAAVTGAALGMVAGYTTRTWLDVLIARLADLTLAFPVILLGLLLAVQVGPRVSNVVVILILLLWARFAKLARAEVSTWRTRDFIALAVVAGARPPWIISRHLLPNILSSLLVLATFQLGWAILTEAGLSFLGAGVPPSQPAWGSMVADGRDLIRTAWWVSTLPGLAIALVVLAVNLLGDWLRDRLDPHLRQV